VGGDGRSFLREYVLLLYCECGCGRGGERGLVFWGGVAEAVEGEAAWRGDAVGVWGWEWLGNGEKGLSTLPYK